MKQYLIVKTSSLGDIIHSFDILNDLQGAAVDWVVDERFASIVKAHPLVRTVFSFDRKHLFRPSFFSLLRKINYDALFDLQGNCKSGLFTFMSRSKEKVGFGRKCVREWPNLLATTKRYHVPLSMNIRDCYKKLVCSHLQIVLSSHPGLRLLIDEPEKRRIESILSLKELASSLRVMVCFNSNWINKQLPAATALAFLKKVQSNLRCSFLFVWGTEEEKERCRMLHESFPECSAVIERLPLPTWQNLMAEVDLVLAVDSGALHLCGTTSTPSFSIFGPTSAKVFKPLGEQHGAYQGNCPYHQAFVKLCPYLRTCPTGACMRSIDPEALFERFSKWHQMSLSKRSKST
jgi:heptosyltransferase-1